jgi:hypothetical protein
MTKSQSSEILNILEKLKSENPSKDYQKVALLMDTLKKDAIIKAIQPTEP